MYIHVTCDTIVVQQYISYSQWSRLDTTAHPSTTVYNNKLCMWIAFSCAKYQHRQGPFENKTRQDVCWSHYKNAKFISSGTALPKRNAKQSLGQCSINASIIYFSLFHSAMIIEHVFTIINSVFLPTSFNLWFGCSDGQSIVTNRYVYPHPIIWLRNKTLDIRAVMWDLQKMWHFGRRRPRRACAAPFMLINPNTTRPAAHQSLNIQATCKGSHQTARMHRLVSAFAVVHTSLSETPYLQLFLWCSSVFR